MKRRMLMSFVALTMSAVIFTQSVPTGILEAFAEVMDNLTDVEYVGAENLFTDEMSDRGNIGNGYIIHENVKNRTLTTKEYQMSDGMIMVQQFSKPVHYLENGEYKDIINILVEGIAGMLYRNEVYYYDKNTLGDVVAVRNEDGEVEAMYCYDAWGNHKVLDSNGAENRSEGFIGNINPIRYRGYYYDTETGFYYLETRYYDPSVMRFINADDYELVVALSCGIPGELNLYSYCANNPILYMDAGGNSVVIAGGMLLFGALAAMIFVEVLYIESTTHVIENTINYVLAPLEESIYNIKNKKGINGKVNDPDPNKRPDQKKQGRELKHKARLNPKFKSRNGRRNDFRKAVRHTPGKNHRNENYYVILLLLIDEEVKDLFGVD